MTDLQAIFPLPSPVVGMVHLLPLPGSPRWGGSMTPVIDQALRDAALLADAGLNGVLVENYLDVPFYPENVPPETLAAVAVCVREVVRSVAIPVGVNLLRNDAIGALAVAAAAGAQFIRVNVHSGQMLTDQGPLVGQAHETLRLRARLGCSVAILADVWVKHATPPPGASLELAAEDTFRRGLADALIVTGTGTGKATDLEQVRRVKAAVPEAPVWIGSGITPETVLHALSVADGLIVGSSLELDGVAGTGVDPDRAQALTRRIRGERD